MKKVFKIIKGVLTALLIMILVVVVIQKFSNNKISVAGFHIFSVASGSMKPEYQIGDIIVSKKVDPKTLEVGDDITYKGEKGNLKGLIITHRIIEKEEKDGKIYFVTKGTSNEFEDPKISSDSIYGKVVYKTLIFSFIGRVMTNVIAYYAIFIFVGVKASYELITTFFIKKDDENEEE